MPPKIIPDPAKAFIREKFRNLFRDKRFSEILSGTAWALSARVIATVVGMVTSVLIARAYGAEILGIIGVLNSFLTLATIFTVMGTGTSILRLVPEHTTRFSPTSAFRVYRKTQYLVAGCSIITGTLFFMLSGYISETIFSKPHLRIYFSIASVFVIFESLMQLNTQATRGLRLIRVFAFMQMLPSVSKLAILAPITICCFHKDNPIYAMFASIAVTALLGAWIMDRAFKRRISVDDTVNPMSAKQILSISLPMLMTATMTFIIGQTGVLMLGIFRPDAEVGYYSIAVKLATLTAFILKAVNSMAAPQFSELYYSGKLDELFYVARKSTKLIFWTTAPILLILIVSGKSLLHWLFGPDFVTGYWAMVFLILGQFVGSISGATNGFMNMTGAQRTLFRIKLFAALLNIGLNLMLTPRFGLEGAAIAAMVSISSWNLIVLMIIKRKYGKTIGYFPIISRR